MLGSTRTGEPLVPAKPATPPRAGPERMRWILTLEDAGVRQRRIGIHVTSELQNWSGTYRFTYPWTSTPDEILTQRNLSRN